MNDTDLIDRRIRRLCDSIEGAAVSDLLRLFAEGEADLVLARIEVLVGDGKLRREGDRLWRVA